MHHMGPLMLHPSPTPVLLLQWEGLKYFKMYSEILSHTVYTV